MDKGEILTQLQRDILQLKEENPTYSSRDIAVVLSCNDRYVRKVISHFYDPEPEVLNEDNVGEILVHSLDLEKKNQRLRDQQRIERKIREEYRYDNAVNVYTKELVKIFENRPKHDIPTHHSYNIDTHAGIFHITDTHFNELINIRNNQYDFKIASKRLRKMVVEAKRIFDAYHIDKVLIAFTGDLINSDRRLDELLNQATNRAKASSLSAILLEQVILDLSYEYDVSVASVSGNEGRVKDEYGSSEVMLTDNYDYNVNEMLKLMFRHDSEVNFIDGSAGENVVNLNGKNILLLHGNQIKANHMKSMQSIRGKYSDMGIKIDFALYGHLHATLITDFYARSASLCGANSYSDNDLQFSSKASQNIHIISDTDIHSFKLDLQNVDGIEGYKIDEDLIAYNAKSHEKISWIEPKKI